MKKAFLLLLTAIILTSLFTAAVFAEGVTDFIIPGTERERSNIRADVFDISEIPNPAVRNLPQESDMFRVSQLSEPIEVVPLEIAPPKTVFVRFDMNGYGDQITEQEIIIGTAVLEPQIPQCAGRVFIGWYNESECILPWNFDALVCADTVLYAGWAEMN